MKKLLFVLLMSSCCSFANAAEKSPAHEDAQFDQMFNAVDSDHDGKISKSEAELKAPAMSEAFERIDTNHDGYLSKQEIKDFTALLRKQSEEFNRRLTLADKDKNGKLSREESKSLPVLHDNFDGIDTNHDNQLTAKEITDFLRTQLEAASKK